MIRDILEVRMHAFATSDYRLMTYTLLMITDGRFSPGTPQDELAFSSAKIRQIVIKQQNAFDEDFNDEIE